MGIVGGAGRRLGEYLDGDPRLLVLDGVEVAVGRVEASLGRPQCVCRRAAVLERGGKGRGSREGASHGRVGAGVMGIVVKALSSPRGAGDGSHWRRRGGLALYYPSVV